MPAAIAAARAAMQLQSQQPYLQHASAGAAHIVANNIVIESTSKGIGKAHFDGSIAFPADRRR
jgi:hypothetical protein